MAPFQQAGVAKYVVSHGPAESSKVADGTVGLWPEAAVPRTVAGLLAAQQQQLTEGKKHENFAEAESLRKAIGPLSSMALPDNSEVEWIFEKHPALAGGLNVINSSRVAQVNVSKVFMAWTSQDNVKHRFVMDGFGKHLEALQQARSDAETFAPGANEVLLQLQNANSLEEFSECRPMAEMLAPLAKNYLQILEGASMIDSAVRKCLVVKATSLLEKQKLETKDWDEDYRTWMGVCNVASRSNKLIKKHMLGKGEGGHTKTAKKLDTFEEAILEVSAAAQVVPELGEAVEESMKILHDGRFYVCTAGITYNVHVRKLQKAPAETTKGKAIKVARGARTFQLWSARSDKREVLPKDLKSRNQFGCVTFVA